MNFTNLLYMYKYLPNLNIYQSNRDIIHKKHNPELICL